MLIDTEIPAQDELTTISNIFQGQWLLFFNAKESNNHQLMRIALNQAISTQDTLTNLFGTQSMLEVLEGWLARDELARMEWMLQITPQPLPQPVAEQLVARTPLRVATTATDQQLPTQPLRVTPPEPPAHQRPAQQQLHPRVPPPPPPYPPQNYEVQAPHMAYQLAAPPPAPKQTIPGNGHQPGILPPETQHQYPPLQYPEQEVYYGQEAPYYQP
jgi:hypothetical protein